jgi:flagellar hook-associated protein 2
MGDIRISGLESKIDIEDTIQKLLAARSYTKLSYEEDKEEVSYDLQAWNDIAALAIDLTGSLDTLRSWETWNEKAAISSDESVLTATADSSAINTAYTVTINNLAQAQNVGSDKASDLTPGGNVETDLVAAGVLAAGSSFSIEGQTITIGASETMNSLVGKINTAGEAMSDANRVMASILDDRLVIIRENTGSTEINATDVGGTPLETLGVLDATGSFANELLAAANASFTVNGALISREDNTGIDDVISGVTLNLLNETSGTPVRLTIDNDGEDAELAVRDFVEKYNALAEQVRFFTQKPLSGDGANGATITALGELYNDSLASEIESRIRKEATDSKYPYLNQTNAEYSYKGKEGVCDSLEDVGIWTQGESNVLAVVDEDKLQYMLQNDFELCGQLFRGVFDEDEGYVHGVASDFYRYADNLSTSITGEIARRTKTLEDKLTELDEKIADQEEQLENYELDLVRQFSAMENAEAQLNAELDWFKQQNFG